MINMFVVYIHVSMMHFAVIQSNTNKKGTMQITTNSVVSIDYTFSDNAGTILGTSKGDDPLIFIQGYGTVFPGLEKFLEGNA